MPRARRRALGTPTLSSGLALGYLSVVVLIPLAALVAKGVAGRLASLLAGRLESRVEGGARADARARGAVVAINAVTGTALAWTLVRDEFPRQADS